MIKTLMRPAYEEIVKTGETIRASDADWTIVRVPMLNDAPKSGQLRKGFLGRGIVKGKLSRADLADFFLRQVSDTGFLRQAPAISN